MNKLTHIENTLRMRYFGDTEKPGWRRGRPKPDYKPPFCHANQLDLILKVTAWRATEEFQAWNYDMISFLFYGSHSCKDVHYIVMYSGK